MAKRKQTVQRRRLVNLQPRPVAPNDPTPERQQHAAFDVVPAPRFHGEAVGRDKIQSTRRRADPVKRMESGDSPWLTRFGAAGLERYGLHIEQANYSSSRSPLASLDSVSGGGSANLHDDILDLRFAARQRLARAANAVAIVDQTALMFVNALLSQSNEETIGALAKRLLHGGMIEARHRCQVAAEALALHFHRA